MECVCSSGVQAVHLMDGSIIMWSSLQNLIYVLFRPENIPYTLLVSGCTVRDFSAQRKENNTPRVRVFTRWRKPLEYTISLSKRVRVEAYPSCLHRQIKLTSAHSIGSLYTSHFISIILLSITFWEGWNRSDMDELE